MEYFPKRTIKGAKFYSENCFLDIGGQQKKGR